MVVYFTFPDISRYKIHKLIYDLRDNKELRERFRKNPQEVMKEYGLSEEEMNVLLRADPEEMFRYGINPYMIHDYRLVVLGLGDRPVEEQVVYKENRK
ncbi:hypothetical protein GFS03_05190 [Sulfolobus sp. E5-1-F]|uniref:hypothetical protein n=1 Tax=Saccharolobus sp. E5-1-F TaxID=2663019 RepID=UPI0012972FFF|nr:hypothetical protein [Sulfolobus sp. E5-1-F]QGA54012.1 hypothetical protein GFS03_05190 [Sulfolobus sp. E5-1-F]